MRCTLADLRVLPLSSSLPVPVNRLAGQLVGIDTPLKSQDPLAGLTLLEYLQALQARLQSGPCPVLWPRLGRLAAALLGH